MADKTVRATFRRHYQIYSIPEHIQKEYPIFAERWEKAFKDNKNTQKELTTDNLEYFAKMDLWSVEEAIYLCHGQRPIHRGTDTALWDDIVVPEPLKGGDPPIGIFFQYEIDDPDSEMGVMFSYAVKAIWANVLKPKHIPQIPQEVIDKELSLGYLPDGKKTFHVASIVESDYLLAEVVPLDFLYWARERKWPVDRRVIKATEGVHGAGDARDVVFRRRQIVREYMDNEKDFDDIPSYLALRRALDEDGIPLSRMQGSVRSWQPLTWEELDKKPDSPEYRKRKETLMRDLYN